MTLSERVAYLKGLAEGLAIDESKPEAKIINCMIDILDDIALSVMDLEDEVAEIGEQLDEVDQDLADVEEIIYDEDEDDCDCDCDCCDEETFEVVCPACGEAIYVDEEILEDGGIECPNCGENLEFDLDFDCDCDCDCCCDEE